jgi:Putative zinc-binding metallo-peptidase
VNARRPRRRAGFVVALTLALGVAAPAPASGAPTDEHGGDTRIVAAYEVHGDALGLRIPARAGRGHPRQSRDEAGDRKIWELFANITPRAYERDVVEFDVLARGSDTEAYVEERSDDPSTWTLAVDGSLVHHPDELRATLVHEFGHLVSLDAAQVPPVLDHVHRAERECPTYYTGEGCALERSYIFEFIDRFWGNRLDEWNDLQSIESDTRYDDAIFHFYLRHQSEFVSEYAATDPLEDFAETFAVYVLRNPPSRSRVRDDKVRFFAEIPEFVASRDTIRASLKVGRQDA